MEAFGGSLCSSDLADLAVEVDTINTEDAVVSHVHGRDPHNTETIGG
jgi:hypothetical protein